MSWKKASETPYVSVLFANRNDNYGEDLTDRINKFIQYYKEICLKYPNLLQFIVCDWNPPLSRKSLELEFDWSPLGNVMHCTVPGVVHNSIGGKRKIYDYFARNVCARKSQAPWCLVLNQDIYLSPKLIEKIASRNLNKRFFYRADRVDFSLKNLRTDLTLETISKTAKTGFTYRHRRHDVTYLTSNSDDQENQTEINSGTYPLTWELIDDEETTIYQTPRQIRNFHIFERCNAKYLQSKSTRQNLEQDFEFCNLFHLIGLHTNASGDFILVPTKSYLRVRGFIETTDFYMHTDSYFVTQLFASGLGQRIFTKENCVYHLNHKETDHYSKETIAWVKHAHNLTEVLLRKQSFKLNNRNWGLWDKIES